MKVSIIIAVCKGVESLLLIIQALKRQTYTNFEVIVAELSDDTDLDWRFRSYGLEIKSCKNMANTH